MTGGRILLWFFASLLLLSACKPKIPSEFIQPDDMEDLLYDYHLAQGMSSQGNVNSQYNSHLYFEAALKKHNVTHAEFDSSLVYYYTRSDRFIDIYKRVQERLGDEALVLGASTSEVERYITQSVTGDTLDVWDGNRRKVLIPTRPYHLMQFYIEADSTYHAGDSFLMTFTNTYLKLNSSKHADAYLAVTYKNDSTVTRTTVVSGNGSTTMRIPSCDKQVKNIRGYICLGQRVDQRANGNEVCFLFMDRIQLIRFHKQKSEATEKTDTVKTKKAVEEGDTLRHVRKFGERPIASDENDKNALRIKEKRERLKNRQQ